MTEWRGWWGDDPPYHYPVFVLTHHAAGRDGGRHHVPLRHDGIESALAQAPRPRAAGRPRRRGPTIQQYLVAGLIDAMHIAISPVVLGGGERLFDDLDGGPDGYEVVEFVGSPSVLHARLARTGSA